MVRLDSCGAVGCKITTENHRRVAVDALVSHCRKFDLVQYRGIAVQHRRIIHYLTETEHLFLIDQRREGACVKHGAGIFKRRSQELHEGSMKKNVERYVLCGINHVANSVDAGDVGDFMGVCNHRRRASGHNESGELFRRQQ